METKIPFFPAQRIYESYQNEFEIAFKRVLSSGRYVLGDEVSLFEQEFAEFLRVEKTHACVSCNSGTDALILGLLACGIGPGDEIIIPAMTAIPTACAVVATGAKPVFADIDPHSGLMDISKIRTLINANTKAIIPVHLYGNLIDIPTLKADLASWKYGHVKIIEDVAQAFGSQWENAYAGTLGDFGAFSFYPTKNLGCFGDGGALLVPKERASEIRELRFYGQASRYQATRTRGINSRLDEVQAALLRVRLNHMNKELELRIKNSKIYFESIKNMGVLEISSKAKAALHLFVVRLESEPARNRLVKFLNEAGIETAIHYPHSLPEQKAFMSYKNSETTQSAHWSKTCLSIPFHPWILESERNRLLSALIKFS